ncbi:MAG: glycosyltransferase family 2 protein [Bacteroidales bacterium]|jgi:GT2 family glycosyltransferase|nr:glycosyltransferase family 2 protein [Bacteroidales bacterium]
MTTDLPPVSVITVNYNQSAVTCEMLESLYRSGYPNLEVFVVDNASPSDRPGIIKERFPQVNFIQSDQNLGFAGGNNIAIKQAKGEYIYLLNNDTTVPDGHIQVLVSLMTHNADYNVVCPKIKLFDDPDILMFAGFTELSPVTFRNKSYGYGEVDKGQHDKSRESAYAHGAAVILRRSVIEKAGLMNENYFLYYEEIDWSTRIKKAGYKIWYTPDTYVLHKESVSTGRNSPLQSYYMNRNRVLYIMCNTSGLKKAIGFIYQMAVAMPKNMLVHGIRGQMKNMKAVMNAWGWCAKNSFRTDACQYSRL